MPDFIQNNTSKFQHKENMCAFGRRSQNCCAKLNLIYFLNSNLWIEFPAWIPLVWLRWDYDENKTMITRLLKIK